MAVDKLLNELDAREEELTEKYDAVVERMEEEDIRLSCEFPELEEEYYELSGAIKEVQRTRDMIKIIFQ